MVRGRVVLQGFSRTFTGVAIIDTGAAVTLIDTSLAEDVGVKYLDRIVKLVIADGHEVLAKLAIVERLFLEDEELPYAHIAIVDFPDRLKERLKSLELSDKCIIGMSTLEILGLIPNTTTGRLEKLGSLLL
ncbi:MAG: aspartyl protease family protein [Candidatus Caldarchaeales archaeon]